jgi:predicted nuclease with TOPRIM domain
MTQTLLFLVRCQQRLLSRCELRLEQTFSEHSDCCETAERCSTELERLRREREALVQRLHEIDSDIDRVTI